MVFSGPFSLGKKANKFLPKYHLLLKSPLDPTPYSGCHSLSLCILLRTTGKSHLHTLAPRHLLPRTLKPSSSSFYPTVTKAHSCQDEFQIWGPSAFCLHPPGAAGNVPHSCLLPTSLNTIPLSPGDGLSAVPAHPALSASSWPPWQVLFHKHGPLPLTFPFCAVLSLIISPVPSYVVDNPTIDLSSPNFPTVSSCLLDTFSLIISQPFQTDPVANPNLFNHSPSQRPCPFLVFSILVTKISCPSSCPG